MRVHAAIEIARPAVEVFAVVADFTRNPEWQRGMRSAVWTSPPPLAVGSTYDQQARFLGRDVVTSFVVTDYEPGASISIGSQRSSFPIEVTRRVIPVSGDRCRVEADVSGDPSGFYRVFRPLLHAMVQRSVKGDYVRLRMLLEG